jgi:hypothetical protein
MVRTYSFNYINCIYRFNNPTEFAMINVRARVGTTQRSLVTILAMRLRGLLKPSHQPITPGRSGMFAGSLVSRDPE